MRFYVLRSNIESGGDRLKDPELISQGIEHFLVTHLQLFASKIFAIEKTWMRSNRDAVLPGRTNCGMHRVGIAGVKTGCNIRRADQLKQLIIVSSAFAKIGIDIDR